MTDDDDQAELRTVEQILDAARRLKPRQVRRLALAVCMLAMQSPSAEMRSTHGKVAGLGPYSPGLDLLGDDEDDVTDPLMR